MESYSVSSFVLASFPQYNVFEIYCSLRNSVKMSSKELYQVFKKIDLPI